MRVATFLPAALLLIVPVLGAPVEVDKRQGGVSASLIAAQDAPAAPAQPCTNGKERRWFEFWRRDPQTITGAYDCSFELAHGDVYRFGPPNSPHGGG